MVKKRHMDDKRFKNALIKDLLKNGFRHPQSKVHHKFKSVKVINKPTDLEGITTDGIVFRFEVKGHYLTEKRKALVTVFFDEIKEGVDNPDNTFYALIRKEGNKYLNPLFYDINQILKALALSKPIIKGTLHIPDELTQKDVEEDKICYPKRKSSTLVADKNMIVKLDKIYNKLSNNNNKIKNTTGVSMNNKKFLMDTVLYGAKSGDKEGVISLMNMFSNNDVNNTEVNTGNTDYNRSKDRMNSRLKTIGDKAIGWDNNSPTSKNLRSLLVEYYKTPNPALLTGLSGKVGNELSKSSNSVYYKGSEFPTSQEDIMDNIFIDVNEYIRILKYSRKNK